MAILRKYLEPGQKQARRESLSPYPAEFPAHNPRRTGKPYRYAWGIGGRPEAGRALLHGIAKFDLEQRQTLLKDYSPQLTGEPVFVARPGAAGEEEGWLLFLTYDPEKNATHLRILNAKGLEEVAVARLPHNVPLVFHGSWVGEVFG